MALARLPMERLARIVGNQLKGPGMANPDSVGHPLAGVPRQQELDSFSHLFDQLLRAVGRQALEEGAPEMRGGLGNDALAPLAAQTASPGRGFGAGIREAGVGLGLGGVTPGESAARAALMAARAGGGDLDRARRERARVGAVNSMVAQAPYRGTPDPSRMRPAGQGRAFIANSENQAPTAMDAALAIGRALSQGPRVVDYGPGVSVGGAAGLRFAPAPQYDAPLGRSSPLQRGMSDVGPLDPNAGRYRRPR